eukprot:1510201-Amphidinium_carterae.2
MVPDQEVSVTWCHTEDLNLFRRAQAEPATAVDNIQERLEANCSPMRPVLEFLHLLWSQIADPQVVAISCKP